MSPPSASDFALLRRLFGQARPYWPHLSGILLLDLLATPAALLLPVPLMLAVDHVLGSKPLPTVLQAMLPDSLASSSGGLLIVVVVLVILIALLSQGQTFGSWLLQTYVGEKLTLAFRARLMQHAQRLSLMYHDTKGSADAIYRVQYDAPAIQWVVIYGLTPFVTAGFTLLGMILVTAALSWQLALVALTVSPVIVLLTHAARNRLRGQWRDVKDLESSELNIIQEVLGALRLVKAFGQEQREQNRFVRRSREGVRARVRVVASESVFGLAVGLTIAGGTAAVLYLGVSNVQAGSLTLGQLLLVMSYLAQLYLPLQTIGQQVTKLQAGLASAERAYALLDQPPEVTERPKAAHLRRAAGTITFEGVCFSYDGENQVLQDIAFELPSGSHLGITGRTGAGKTTLVNLMGRLYDPTEGRVLLDGTDIRDLRLADLRNQFALMLQEPVLFSTTIGENIAYGRPSATQAEILEAAKAAHAHQFIEQLPQGYETQVGERGHKLSGGQRQRISLARAFLKDAPMLIFDEPTSAVDPQTEAAIMEAMAQLMEGRTTLMIAHRSSTLVACDYLLELEGGRIGRFGPALAFGAGDIKRTG